MKTNNWAKEKVLNEPVAVQNWGTFDVANYGDLIFPLILEMELKKRNPLFNVTFHSPRGDTYNLYRERIVERIIRFDEPDFLAQIKNTRAIVLGGGDIFRFDDCSLAHVYNLPVHEAEYLKLYRLFIEDLGIMSHFMPVMWNAVGIPHEFSLNQKKIVLDSTAKIKYLTVRDPVSQDRLFKAGIRRQIFVVPDTVFLLERLYTRPSLTPVFNKIKKLYGIPDGRKLLCLQLISSASPYEDEIVRLIQAFLTNINTEFTVLLLPIGVCHADDIILKTMHQKLGAKSFFIKEPFDLKTIAAVISHADIFAGTSLHGNITAYCYGVPHIFLDFFKFSKIQGTAGIMGCDEWVASTPESMLTLLNKLKNRCHHPAPSNLPAIIKSIDQHFDFIAQAILAQTAHNTAVQEQFHPELWLRKLLFRWKHRRWRQLGRI